MPTDRHHPHQPQLPYGRQLPYEPRNWYRPEQSAAPRGSAALRYVRGHRHPVLAVLAVPVVGAIVTSVIVTSSADAEQSSSVGVVQAESYVAESGVRMQNTNDTGGGKNVGWLADGDWMRYQGIDLGTSGTLTVSVRVAAATDAGGTLEVHTGSQTGPVLADYPITTTGGWQRWLTRTSVSTTAVAGKQDVFVVLRSLQPNDFVNLNWISFQRTLTAIMPGSPTASAKPTAGPTGSATAAPPTSTAGWVSVDPIVTSGITLASGTSFSTHADFFNAWQDDALADRVRNRLDQGVKCNSGGGF